jgi:hypothetical protein
MSEGAKEKVEAKVKGKGRAKKAVAVVAMVFVALLVLSALSDAIDDACVRAGVLGGLAGKLKDFGGKVKEGLKTVGEKVESAFKKLAGWLFGEFKASAPSTSTPPTSTSPSTSTTSTSTTTTTNTPSTPSTPAQPVEEVKEPVVLSVKAVPVKVSPKLFSDEVSSMEDPKAIEVPKDFNWTWTDECAHSGKHSLKGRAFFWLKLSTNRSDFNLYDRLIVYVKVVASEDVLKELNGILMSFGAQGCDTSLGFPLEPKEWDTPFGKLSVNKEGEWWRIELSGIRWGYFDAHDKFGFSVVPLPPKLYNSVTFYVDDLQLYSSRSDACLLLVEARIPYRLIHDNKTYSYFKERTEVKNLRTSEMGVSYKAIIDRELLRRLGKPTINEVYVPISVQRGDVLEVTFSFTYYYNDGKYLHEDDALVFNRTVTLTVE